MSHNHKHIWIEALMRNAPVFESSFASGFGGLSPGSEDGASDESL